jgi:hypothetical protein
MVRQQGTNRPDDRDRKTEGDSTSHTLAKGMTDIFDILLSR